MIRYLVFMAVAGLLLMVMDVQSAHAADKTARLCMGVGFALAIIGVNADADRGTPVALQDQNRDLINAGAVLIAYGALRALSQTVSKSSLVGATEPRMHLVVGGNPSRGTVAVGFQWRF